MKKFAIGADIGGSHISCAAIDLDKKTIVESSITTQAVDNQASAKVILDSWTAALNRSITAIEAHELAGIGFAMPGPFNYAQGIALFTHEVAKYQNLHGINVSERIKPLLHLKGECDVRYLNDATSFAVGEAWLGKASGVRRSMSITLGTGFGSAFVDDGIPVVAREDVPEMGCVWYLPFQGKIADESFSTRWFIKQYTVKSGRQAAGVKEIADNFANDPVARDIFIEFGTNLGTFLAPCLKKFDAEALVIGGNIAAAYNLFGSSLGTSLADHAAAIPVHVSDLKENAALIGSARLFDEGFWRNVKPLLASM
jgi:glucokinase